ncbi:hypothetical protein QCB45_06335 [Thiomicrorhabdus sp. ZW0627]|uniref:hypothetical protein n=1 Tax=Thiomicrorhabdus sp. ZW0627 TaxID=3039774 RepID=UPI00243728C7|nr:hypothetical protein [Thiomicrorhabdus sp. ZW0627]MDG6773942.1 hypothetical protein [Thiomicrorhabdus sp. ZW0627]
MKAVFYLNDQGVGIYSDDCKSLSSPLFFDWEDTLAIEEWLSTFPSRGQVSIVIDLVDEDIVVEAYPKLYLWERSAIRKQLVERLESEGADFIYTEWTGLTQTNEEGRVDELILSASIMAPAHIMNFISSLEEAEIIVKGIYSAPFMLADYFKKYVKNVFNLTKKEMNSPFFIISRQSKNTYRQTFFYEGQLRISRLIEIEKEDDDFQGIQSALIHEAKLARNYIYNQNLSGDNHAIGYIFLDNDENCLIDMDQRCLDEGLVTSQEELQNALFKALTFNSLGYEQVICNVDPKEYYAAEAMADYVLNASPTKSYFNDYVKKINAVLLGYRSFIGFNSLLLISLIGFALVFGIGTYLDQHKLELLDQKIQEHKVEKDRLQKEVKLQTDAKKIKASVDFSEAILGLKSDRTMGFNVEPISEVFSKHEHVQLNKLEWKQIDRFDSNTYEIDLEGWVFPFVEYYRDPVKWVDALMDDLRKLPNVKQVDLTQEPLNRNLKQALTVLTKDETVTALEFKIKMRVNDAQSK